jgi:hypothetical protein
MKPPFLAPLLVLLACTSSTPPAPAAPRPAPKALTYEGGDGLSCQTRIAIRGAGDEETGVDAEYDWLRAKYAGATFRQQALIECDGHPVDRLDITTAKGKDVAIYFDISDFFGKTAGQPNAP